MGKRIFIAELRPKYPEDFVWKAGWLQEGHAALQLGIDLEAATSQLGKLYPASECRRIVENGQGRVIDGLFYGDGWSYEVADLLCLGADLAICPDWVNRPQLIKRLKNEDEYDAARFEVGLWAGLQRVDADVVYLDPDPSKKAPDLLVQADKHRIALEAKTGPLSNSHRNYDLLYRWIGDAATLSDALKVPHHLHFFPSSSLAAAFKSLVPTTFKRKFEVLVRNAFLDFYAGRLSNLAIGVESAVGSLGLARMVEVPDHWQPSAWHLDIVGIQPASTDDELNRAARKVREAAEQLAATDADIRVAIVWTSSIEVPARDAIGRLAIALAAHRSPPAGVDWIVLFNSHAIRGEWSPDVATVPMTATDYDIASTKWYRGLTQWKGGM